MRHQHVTMSVTLHDIVAFATFLLPQPRSYIDIDWDRGLLNVNMSEGRNERSGSPTAIKESAEFTVLRKGRSLKYAVPSFPVFTVQLREVKL